MGGLCCKGTKEPEPEAELSEEVDGDVGQNSSKELDGMGDERSLQVVTKKSSLDVNKARLSKPKSQEEVSNEQELSPCKVKFSVISEK